MCDICQCQSIHVHKFVRSVLISKNKLLLEIVWRNYFKNKFSFKGIGRRQYPPGNNGNTNTKIANFIDLQAIIARITEIRYVQFPVSSIDMCGYVDYICKHLETHFSIFQFSIFRMYAVRRIRDGFKENKTTTNVQQQFQFAKENLEMIKRQVSVEWFDGFRSCDCDCDLIPVTNNTFVSFIKCANAGRRWQIVLNG